MRQKGQIQIRARMSTLLYWLSGAFTAHLEGGGIRIRVQYSPARLLTGNRLILKQRSIRPLLEGSVFRADGDDQSGRFLQVI